MLSQIQFPRNRPSDRDLDKYVLLKQLSLIKHTHTNKKTWEGDNRKQKRLDKCKNSGFGLIHKLRMLSEALTGVVCVCSFFFSPFSFCVEAKDFLLCYFKIIIILIIITLAVLTCTHDEGNQLLPLAKVRSMEIFMSYWLAWKMVQLLWKGLPVHSEVEHVFGL